VAGWQRSNLSPKSYRTNVYILTVTNQHHLKLTRTQDPWIRTTDTNGLKVHAGLQLFTWAQQVAPLEQNEHTQKCIFTLEALTDPQIRISLRASQERKRGEVRVLRTAATSSCNGPADEAFK
jgi:hypothetical protein